MKSLAGTFPEIAGVCVPIHIKLGISGRRLVAVLDFDCRIAGHGNYVIRGEVCRIAVKRFRDKRTSGAFTSISLKIYQLGRIRDLCHPIQRSPITDNYK